MSYWIIVKNPGYPNKEDSMPFWCFPAGDDFDKEYISKIAGVAACASDNKDFILAKDDDDAKRRLGINDENLPTLDDMQGIFKR